MIDGKERDKLVWKKRGRRRAARVLGVGGRGERRLSACIKDRKVSHPDYTNYAKALWMIEATVV